MSKNEIIRSVSKISVDPQYSYIAGKSFYDMHFKKACMFDSLEYIFKVYEHGRVQNRVLDFVTDNKETFDKLFNKYRKLYCQNKSVRYETLQTLSNGYLMKDVDGGVLESPIHMMLRLACAVNDLKSPKALKNVKRTFKEIFDGKYIHGTPTIYNAGICNKETHPKCIVSDECRSNLSSCFTLEISNRNCNDLFSGLKKIAKIVSESGGVGVDLSNIDGDADVFMRVLSFINDIVEYNKSRVDYKSKRNGSVKVFLPVWHRHIMTFLESKQPTQSGYSNGRANALSHAVLITDDFMRKLEDELTGKNSDNKTWRLFEPHETIDGVSVRDLVTREYGSKNPSASGDYKLFKAGRFTKTNPSRIMGKILNLLLTTGEPSIMYIDTVNRCNPLKHISNIAVSNLCMEIVQVTKNTPDEKIVSVCNLASVVLTKFVTSKKTFDYSELGKTVELVTRNLNHVSKTTYSSVDAANYGNKKSKSIGLGVQGFWDLFRKIDVEYGSEEAQRIASLIFETIYYYALKTSNEIAKENGDEVPTWFSESPYSKGWFHFHETKGSDYKGFYDWKGLSESIKKHGLANMQLVAVMPTVSTSLITGSSEGIDPVISACYTRSERDSTYFVWDEHIVDALKTAGLWNKEMRNAIIANHGSLVGISNIPSEIKKQGVYAFSIPMSKHIKMICAISPFVDQSISMNLYVADDPNGSYSLPTRVLSALVYGWKNGLKTGIYYLRVKPKTEAMMQCEIGGVCSSCN